MLSVSSFTRSERVINIKFQRLVRNFDYYFIRFLHLPRKVVQNNIGLQCVNSRHRCLAPPLLTSAHRLPPPMDHFDTFHASKEWTTPIQYRDIFGADIDLCAARYNGTRMKDYEWHISHKSLRHIHWSSTCGKTRHVNW